MATILSPGLPGFDHLRAATAQILDLQLPDGAILWFDDGPWDPWNHAECVMALGVMGEHDAARAGFDYLAATQDKDGSWLAGYGNALPFETRDRIARVEAPQVRDSNFAAYPATALWHHFHLHRDLGFVRRHWPIVRAALRFVLTIQHDAGDISWCYEAHGTSADDAVLAGNASIYKSLGHGLALAALVRDPHPGWELARTRLGHAIRTRPDRFDRGHQDRSSFAMDWYYPILSGALGPAATRDRLRLRHADYVTQGRGVRCVGSEPWVTVAESAELAITLAGLGFARAAQTLLGWQEAHRDADGAYWMGYQYAEDIFWPLEKPSWTQAAMILAQDAVLGATAASKILGT